VARGADTIAWFQWRQSRAGSEKFHSAVVPHAGADSARFREVEELGRIAGRLGELVGSRVESKVAVLHDYQAIWASEGPCMPSSELDALEAAHAVHRVLHDRGVTCDVVHPSADLTAYAVVVVPQLYLVTDAHACAVAAAAEAGAQVVVTYFSGISDENDHVRLGGYPGAFRDLLGVRVEEFYPLLPEQRVRLTDGLGAGCTGSQWSELLDCPDAEPVVRLADGAVPGTPAVTRREVATSAAWYVATRLDATANDGLVARVLAESGVRAPVPAPDGVEVVRRASGDLSWLFALNHTDRDAVLDVAGHDLVTGADVERLDLAAGGCAVVRERR
jgi:beta-galactosidase